jgi:hypothetical protein
MILVDLSSLEILEVGSLLASRIQGQVVVAGRRFHPLTPAIWAEVYQVMQTACQVSKQAGQYQALRPLLRRWQNVTERAEAEHGADALRDAVQQRIEQQKKRG